MNSLEEIALKIAKEVSPDGWLCGPDAVEEYTRLLVAALGAQEPVYVIFDGEPGNEGPRFVEVETANQNSVRAGEWSDYPLNKHLARLGPFFAAPVLPSVPEVTDAMITAYLKANDAYWHETDALEPPPDKWRIGTPRDATRVSLEAAFRAAAIRALK